MLCLVHFLQRIQTLNIFFNFLGGEGGGGGGGRGSVAMVCDFFLQRIQIQKKKKKKFKVGGEWLGQI